jgi:L-ascorbate metabolism protein UlaG (beta-lactamase superfamily)
VYAHPDVVAALEVLGDAAVAVEPGETFSAGGFSVRAVGGRHADIYDGLPGCANIGFVVEGALYHPGDSLFVPSERIQHLLVPISGPWLHLAAAIDFVRAVAPAHAYPIHDMLLSDIGRQGAGRWLESKGEAPYFEIPVGTAVDV